MTIAKTPIEQRQPVGVIPCPNPHCKKPVVARLASSGQAVTAACLLAKDGCGTTVNFNKRASRRMINEFEAAKAAHEGGKNE